MRWSILPWRKPRKALLQFNFLVAPSVLDKLPLPSLFRYRWLYLLLAGFVDCLLYLLSFNFSTIATATGLVKFNHNCRSRSSVYFLASLMMQWCPFCTASSSNDLTAAIVRSALQQSFTAALILVFLYSLSTDFRPLPSSILDTSSIAVAPCTTLLTLY